MGFGVWGMRLLFFACLEQELGGATWGEALFRLCLGLLRNRCSQRFHHSTIVYAFLI